MSIQLDEFKTRQRAVWEAGEYGALSPYIADVGRLVASRGGARPGMRVLDVACGTGNAALPAARAGARVTGVDLTPTLLDGARSRARAEGLEIDFQEADAENLPFEDAAFDLVLSTFGHMFAPRHQRTADEMMRVCRRGGTIALATWTPEGTVGAVFAASARYMPPPPDYASPPISWGRDDYVRERFQHARAFSFERHINWIECASVEEWAEFFLARFGPLVTARAMLGDRFSELRDQIVAIWTSANTATDGGFRLPQEYLVSVITV